MLWILSETHFNQNWFKLSYIISQTCKWNISTHSDHDHICWASHDVISMFTCAVINIRLQKNMRDLFFTCWHFNLLLWFLVIKFYFNMCLFYMHFRHENTLQSNMIIVHFSPKTVSPPCCHLTLPLRAYATVMSTCFFSCESYLKKLILEKRTVQCIVVWCAYEHPIRWDSTQGLYIRLTHSVVLWNYFSSQQE